MVGVGGPESDGRARAGLCGGRAGRLGVRGRVRLQQRRARRQRRRLLRLAGGQHLLPHLADLVLQQFHAREHVAVLRLKRDRVLLCTQHSQKLFTVRQQVNSTAYVNLLILIFKNLRTIKRYNNNELLCKKKIYKV